MIRLIVLCLVAALGSGVAQAQEQEFIGEFGAWRAYKDRADGSAMCFAYTEPVRRLPDGLRRGPAYVFLTHRPAQNIRNQFTVDFGFPLDSAAATELSVGSDSFELVENGEDAWLGDAGAADRLVNSFQKGATASIVARSQRGNSTTDQYSLSGFTRALQAIDAACPGG